MSGPVTTFNNPEGQPDIPWSYSRLKNYETCPKRHWHYDIFKDVKEPESDQLKDGFFVHDVLAKRIANATPLPPQVIEYEPWAVRVLTGPGQILVEQKLAIALDISQRVYVLGHGAVVFHGGPQELLAAPAIRKEWLEV